MNTCVFCGEESDELVCEKCKRAGFSFTVNPCEKEERDCPTRKRSLPRFRFDKIDLGKYKSNG